MKLTDYIKKAYLLDTIGNYEQASFYDNLLLKYAQHYDALNSGSTNLGSDPSIMGTATSDVGNIIKNWGPNSPPVGFKGPDGQNYLLIHGSPSVEGKVYFSTGNGESISEDEMPEWMNQNGFGGYTIMSCHAGQISNPNLKTKFTNTGTIGIGLAQNPENPEENNILFQSS